MFVFACPIIARSVGYLLQTHSNVIVQIDIIWYLFETRLEAKIFASWTKQLSEGL